MNDISTPQPSNSAGTAKVIYILYLASIVVGLTSLIGVVMAYINRSEAPEWLASHYQYQIRTFWIGLLYTLIGVLLTTVLIGFAVLLFTLVWLIVRCVKGIKALDMDQPVANPTGWMF